MKSSRTSHPLLAGLGAAMLVFANVGPSSPAAVVHDLTPLHDAARVLVNPHKGWYHHFPDNHPNKYQIARDADLLEFPGMDHLYIRLAWAYLEPKEGQFDWAVIDRIIEKWTAHGLGIAFRISCKETSTDRIEQQFATPRWVMEAGAKGGHYRMGKATGPEGPWEPAFDDRIFMAKLDQFLAAFAARYDAKPWLRYVDIGSIGDWGEGHCWAGSRKDLSFAVAKYGKGKKGPDYFRGALGLLHATYIGYHGDAREWLTDNPELTRELLNKCGYWLFPLAIELPLPAALQPGSYDLAIGLFDAAATKVRPVEFALQESARDSQGYYRVGTVAVSDKALGAEACWARLFNGENLDGWVVKCRPADRDKMGCWRVVDGTITAETPPGSKHDYIWLLTEREYGDSTLRLKVQTYSECTGNSGIQVRSRYDDNAGWLDGPQVDINPAGTWRNGFIYDETRGVQVWLWPNVGKPANAKPEHAPPGSKWWHADDRDVWNDVEITCRGTRITTVVNGVTIADYDGAGRLDDETHRTRNVGMKGHIGLQIHPGGELRLRFKDLELHQPCNTPSL